MTDYRNYPRADAPDVVLPPAQVATLRHWAADMAYVLLWCIPGRDGGLVSKARDALKPAAMRWEWRSNGPWAK